MAYDRIGYNRVKYADILKEMVQEKENIYYIAGWANEVATSHYDYFAEDFCEIFERLRFMDEGFELSYEEIEEMADYLLLGCPLPKRPDTPSEGTASKALAVRKCLDIADFTQELRERFHRKQAGIIIAKWAHAVYSQQPELFNNQGKELVLTIIAMKDHPQFKLSDEELDLIADLLNPSPKQRSGNQKTNYHGDDLPEYPLTYLSPAYQSSTAIRKYNNIDEFRNEFQERLLSYQEKVILGSWVEDVYKKQPELFHEDAIPLVEILISLKKNPNPLLSDEEIAIISNLLTGMNVPLIKINYPNKKTK